jgi:hypothetical protein
MQNIIQIYLGLLKLSRKQDTILNIGDLTWEYLEERFWGEILVFG